MMAGYLIMCAIFGTTFLAIKVGLDAGLPPLLFAGLRFTAAGLITLAWLRLRRAPGPTHRGAFGQMALVGLTNTAITFAALFWAEQFLPSSLAAICTACSPTLTTLLVRRSGDRATRWQLVGVAAGLTGVALAMVPGLRLEGGLMGLAGVGAILLGEACTAWGQVRSRQVMAGGVAPLTFSAWQMLFGGVALLLGSLAVETPRYGTLHFSGAAWGALLYLTIPGSVIARGLLFWLIARTGPLFPTTWTYISPLLATLVGALALGEPAGWQTLAGLVLVVGGAAATNDAIRAKLLHRHRHRPLPPTPAR